jgi:hypothetical protein
MPRPKKGTGVVVPPASGRKKPVQIPDVRRRIEKLNERETTLAKKSGTLVLIKVKIPIARKEAYLDLAERHGEDLSTVVRACIEYGYRHFARFAAVTEGGPSPFVAGAMTEGPYSHPMGQPPPVVQDRSGAMWPPAALPPVFGTPQVPGPQRFERPRQGVPMRESYSTVTDDLFAPEGRVQMNGHSVPIAGILPSSGGFPEPMPQPDPEPFPSADFETSLAPPSVEPEAPSFAFGATEEPVAAE